MNIWVIFIFLAIMSRVVRTFLYKISCVLVSLEYLYVGVEFLGHMVTLCLSFWVTVKLLSIDTITFYIPTRNVCVLISSAPRNTYCVLSNIWFPSLVLCGAQSILNLKKFNLSIFFLVACVFGVIPKEMLTDTSQILLCSLLRIL